jgi:hypothetical protein
LDDRCGLELKGERYGIQADVSSQPFANAVLLLIKDDEFVVSAGQYDIETNFVFSNLL